MKKILLIAFTALLISGCSKTPEEEVEDLYQTGIEQIAEFNLPAADSSIAQIFEIEPGSMKGLIGISKINDAKLQYYDAIKNYSIVLDNTTDYEDAYKGLFYGYTNLGYYEDAIEVAIHYNKVWHENTHTKYILGEAFKNINEIERATGYFEQAVKSEYEHKNAAQFMLAATLIMQGFTDEALKEAASAKDDNIDDPIYYNAAAEYYETLGLIGQAMEYNKKLFNYNVSNMQNVWESFQRALNNNYYSDARIIIQTLEDQQADSLVIQGLQLFYALHVDDKSMIRKYGSEYFRSDTESLSGRLYNLYALAEVSDKLALIHGLKTIQIENERGQHSEEFGEFLYYSFMMRSVKYEKNPATLKQLEDTRGLRKNRLEYKLELAFNRFIVGEHEEAYDYLRKTEAGHQTKADWLTGLAGIWGHVVVKKFDKAEELYQKALKVDPNYKPAFLNYLELLERIGKKKEAVELFKTYPQFEQNNYLALLKTKYLFLNKQYDEGLSQFTKFYQYASGDILLINELIEVLKDEKQNSIIQSLTVLLDNSNPDMMLLLANLLQEQNEFENSIQFVDQLLTIEPRNADALVLKARSMYYTGDKTEAYDLFEKILVDFPKNPNNLLYYSQILSLEGIDFSRASNMARESVFEGYGQYKYLINLADIYYRMGRYDLCRGEALKATLAEQNNPYPFFRLGMTNIMSKDKERWQEQGIEYLQKAIDLGLTGQYLKEANTTLKSI